MKSNKKLDVGDAVAELYQLRDKCTDGQIIIIVNRLIGNTEIGKDSNEFIRNCRKTFVQVKKILDRTDLSSFEEEEEEEEEEEDV